MATPYFKTFDDLLDGILTDYKNLSPSPDVSVGSPVYIKAACLASMLWGLYRYQDYIANQPYPDTCDSNNLNHWGSIYGIARLAGETDNDYATRVVATLQAPPAGGTALDYKTWALSVTTTINVAETFLPSSVEPATGKIFTNSQDWAGDTEALPNIVTLTTTGTLPSGLSTSTPYYVIHESAYTIQLAASRGGSVIVFGDEGTGVHTLVPDTTVQYHAQAVTVLTPPAVPVGTVTVVVSPNNLTNTLTDTAKAAFVAGYGGVTLQTAINNYINARRPVTALANSCVLISQYPVTVEITVTPTTLSSAQLLQISSDIQSKVAAFAPGDSLYMAQLQAICVNNGAISATLVSPTTDVTPAYNEIITLASAPSIHF